MALLSRASIALACAALLSVLVAYTYGSSGRTTGGVTTEGAAGLSVVDSPVSLAGASDAAGFDLADQPKPKSAARDVAEASEPARVETAREDLLASGSFRLAVPFRSQKDGDRFQGSNCGPASLAMVLEAFSMVQKNADLRWLAHTYQGTAGMRGGTALQHLATVGGDFGLQPIGLYDAGEAFHHWSVAEVREEVEAGRPVIPLVKYRLLPGHEASTIPYDHYVVIYGLDGDRFLYHDPAYATAEEGAAHWITTSQLDAAMRVALEPRQAVAFAPGLHASIPVTAL